jgi:hypothetical protein
MKNKKPIASLSLDLDNQWSYMKTHGDTGWEAFPSYLHIVVPRVLQFLQKYDLTITFFVVGQDAALEKNHAHLQAIADAGHEIGNHSFHHEPWLHTHGEEEINIELALAEECIEQATGKISCGFRGPGYSCSQAVLRVLVKRGYVYDASTLPTFFGPLARAYYFFTAKLSPEEKNQRKQLFGTIRDGLRSLHPYQWHVDIDGKPRQLLEIPVTTMPIIKAPFHVSYILYISTFSVSLALLYFRASLKLCRLTGVQPSLLLHPLDFLGYEDVEELSFFPAMNLSRQDKLSLVHEIIRLFSRHYTILNLNQYAQETKKFLDLSTIKPNFRFRQKLAKRK